MKVVIRSHFNSPRLEYIATWLYERWGLDVDINAVTINPEDIIINYGKERPELCTLSIPDAKLLSKEGLSSVEINAQSRGEACKLFYNAESKLDLDFDFFSMAFYLLSRYEEYVYSDTDEHGRWISAQSAAIQFNFINKPIVDIWLTHIEQIIESKTRYRFNRSTSITYVPTIDIDIPYAYKDKEWRNVAGLIRDTILGDKVKVKARMSYWRDHKDPYDTYEYILEKLRPHSNTIFFFLCKYQKSFDENHLVDHNDFVALVARIAQVHHIGIHPSYSSNSESSSITAEKELLKEISGTNITRSRQHFLKFTIPKTYQTLIESGITEDHSMAYADQIGFRASTCHPFLWYDLSREVTTNLTVHSPSVMDVTLQKYLKLDPEEAIDVIDELKNTISSVSGNLEFIWHNSSFSSAHGWDGWQKTFEYLLKD